MAEATGNFFGNKITNKIMGVLKNSQQNNSERQLQTIIIKKYLKKNIYLYKKDKKLFMN